uniref:Uncharacterized protein n=1 Tax=Anguilla anguilla TaxID=7936 RepID=A0A0E9VD72_ANGAN
MGKKRRPLLRYSNLFSKMTFALILCGNWKL